MQNWVPVQLKLQIDLKYVSIYAFLDFLKECKLDFQLTAFLQWKWCPLGSPAYVASRNHYLVDYPCLALSTSLSADAT